MWKQVEVWVCDFCESEDCNGECQTPKVVKSLPDRVEYVTMTDVVTGHSLECRIEFRPDGITIIHESELLAYPADEPAQSPNLAQ